MASQLGPIEICCDAPPYVIVQACQKLGFQVPLDVRWLRTSHFLNDGASGLPFWNLFFTKGPSEKKICTCGEQLPVLENFAFTFSRGKVLSYNLGQCRKCRTIFWEEGLAPEYGALNGREPR
jgi:hypothetical protein